MPASALSTAGRLAYAVGDVHGCSARFSQILGQIRADAAKVGATVGRPLLVLLGDYIDRGPDTQGVIETILDLKREGAFQVVALRGNHEAALLDFIDDPAEGARWLDYGGVSTLTSYGVPPATGASDLPALRDALLASLPRSHLAFLRELPLCAILGDYLFVHAGVRPDVPLEDQSDEDLLWIREPFLAHPRPSPYVVVHGHTPSREPFASAARIGLDTGAFATGILSALRVYNAEQRIIQARAGDPSAQ